MLNLYETMGIEAIYKPEYPFKAAKKFLQYRGKWCIIES